MQGSITLLHPRGYGFITTTAGERIFFHFSQFQKGADPVLGGLVEFEIGPPIQVGKKPQALRVRYRKDEATEVSEATIHGFVSGGVQ